MVVLDWEEPALAELVQEVPDPEAPGDSGQGVLVQELPRQKVPGLKGLGREELGRNLA